ncbi:aldehyde dehydrogenase [Candidatus Fermentibacteria bacterium]|nr:aldehyde dehydrogenase [Candidatus Fermentibacteria bacterium]
MKVVIPKELLDKANLIGGVWSNAESGKTFEVQSPVTGEVIAKVPLCDTADVEKAVQAARRVRDEFKDTPVLRRVELCNRIKQLVLERKEIIAKVMTLEQGKPCEGESIPDLDETALLFTDFAEDIVRLEMDTYPLKDPNKMAFSVREAIGVTAVITPWNYPVLIPAEYIAPALVVGNPIVFKPASYTPLSAILFARCIQDALDELGFPKGIFNLITGPGGSVGNHLVGHPHVDCIAFTGETVTGQAICSRAGLKRTLMELGGNGPQIVCDDADLAKAAAAAAFGCYTNAGQVCCATERILVDARVHDKFVKLMLEETEKWKVGDPFDKKTNVGPLNNEPTAAKTETHLDDAVKKGARILVGGKRESGRPTGLYFQPTVIDGVTPSMLLNKEETFGPVAPIISFESDEEAVQIANGSGYGLQMAVFTSSIKKCFFYSKKLRTGTIVVNDTTDYWEDLYVPFGGGGGTKSGHGRIATHFTMEDLTYIKTTTIDFANAK